MQQRGHVVGERGDTSSDTNLGTKPTLASSAAFPALGLGKELLLMVTSGHQWSPVALCDGNAAGLGL